MPFLALINSGKQLNLQKYTNKMFCKCYKIDLPIYRPFRHWFDDRLCTNWSSSC